MTLLRRDAFYVSIDDLAEQAYCEQRALFRALGSEAALEQSFRGQKGEEAMVRNAPEEITIFPDEAEALRAVGAALGARTWREIFVAPPRLLTLAAFAKAVKKAKVDADMGKRLAEKLKAVRKAKAWHLRLVDENPTLFRLWDEARSGSRTAQARLDSILGAADAHPHRGVFKFRLLRVAASAEIARNVVVESRVVGSPEDEAAALEVARVRANLAAYLFKRPRWRVELKVGHAAEPSVETGDRKNPKALDRMKRLVAFLRKEAEPEAPHPARCVPCEYKTRCSIYKRMKRWRYRGGARSEPDA